MRARLEQQQRAFAAALLDESAAAAVAPELLGGSDTAQHFAAHRAHLEAVREKALARAYPVVRALVGEAFFAALARQYGAALPGSADLNDAGATFASFVSAFEQAQSLPYLADVAALEWLAHRAAQAGDAPPLRRDRIAALTPDELLAARFAVHPACAWLQSPFPVASIWLAHQPDSGVVLPDSLERGEFALVVRPQWTPRVLVSRAGETAALEALREGADMDGAIAAAVRVDRGFDFARAIVRWLDHAVLVEPV